MGWFKKKDVPEELPDLSIGGTGLTDSLANVQTDKGSEKSYKSLPVKKSFSGSASNSRKSDLIEDDEQGYFKDLVKGVTDGSGNFEEIDSWYKDKFLPEDMVFHMREYWEKQQPEILLKNVSGDLKNKLMNKTNKLHKLEKEWQEVYFHLMEKEDLIRKEEKELKGDLSEFINLYKSSLKKKKD